MWRGDCRLSFLGLLLCPWSFILSYPPAQILFVSICIYAISINVKPVPSTRISSSLSCMCLFLLCDVWRNEGPNSIWLPNSYCYKSLGSAILFLHEYLDWDYACCISDWRFIIEDMTALQKSRHWKVLILWVIC